MRRIGSPKIRQRRQRDDSTSRGGIALLVVIVALGIVSAIGLSMLKMTLAQHRQAERELFDVQARWLVESGVERAAVRLQADATYVGETWSLPAKELSGRRAARVEIKVKPVENAPQRRHVIVVADFPADTDQRARRTVTRNVDL